jgi:hypothetical protein
MMRDSAKLRLLMIVAAITIVVLATFALERLMS